MKKSLLVAIVLCLSALATIASAQITNSTHPANSPYGSIQAAINDGITVTNDVITLGAGAFTGAVTVNKAITLQGVGPTTIITNATGVGITVTVSGVTLASLKVSGCSGSGVYASGISNLTLTNVESDGNGTGTAGFGFDLKGITGTSVFTGLIANNNHKHGLAIGSGSTGVSVSGGTFTGNGQVGDPTTGGGIIVYANSGTTTSGVSITGTVNANTNKTAGIYLECDPTGHVSNTTIGEPGTLTANDNGSTGGTYGTGGAAVLVHGPCDHTTIKAVSSNSGLVNPTAGLVVLGTDVAGSNSPTTTVVQNSTLTGFNSTSPAGTMKATGNSQTLICVNDVDATNGNNIVGFSTGFQVEDALYHKMDDAALGLFRGPGTVLFVTPNSGSINRAIGIANNPYSVTEIDVENGTYAENVVVNQAITLNGQGANTIIHPSSGAPINVTVSGVTLENLHFYGAFTPTVAPTATSNSFTISQPIKVYLEGAWRGSAMGIELENPAGDNSVVGIPHNQPYNVAPWNYSGPEVVNIASYPTNMVDWILVDLRTGTAGATKVARRAAALLSNGSVKDVDGTSDPAFTYTANGIPSFSYYIVLQHRIHIAAMSANPVSISATVYDFTTGLGQYFAGDAKNLGGGKFAMYAGDYSGDAFVDASDYNGPVTDYFNTGYFPSDLNMDGFVDASDFNPVATNYFIGTNVPDPDFK